MDGGRRGWYRRRRHVWEIQKKGKLNRSGFHGLGASDIACPLCEQSLPEQLLMEAQVSQGRTFRCPTTGCTETFILVR